MTTYTFPLTTVVQTAALTGEKKMSRSNTNVIVTHLMYLLARGRAFLLRPLLRLSCVCVILTLCLECPSLLLCYLCSLSAVVKQV